MKLKTIACAIAVGVLFNQITLANNEVITYKNALGSVLKLHFAANDTLTGSFTTAVASKECRHVIGTSRPIIGYVVNTVKSKFCCKFPFIRPIELVI